MITQKLKKLIHKPDYFFIIGPGRGGTSLLASMLDFHPKLQVGFERFAFDYLLGNQIRKEEKYHIEIRLQQFDEACAEVATMNHRLWGNKITTEQIAALKECEAGAPEREVHLFEKRVVKNHKVIFVVRDGRHCVLSKMQRTDQSYEEAVERWKYATQVLRYFRDASVSLHLCRYEDIVENPRRELQTICRFLGVPYDKEMLQGPVNPKMPDMYAGKILKPVAKLTEEQLLWTNDMKSELKWLGYINEN